MRLKARQVGLAFFIQVRYKETGGDRASQSRNPHMPPKSGTKRSWSAVVTGRENDAPVTALARHGTETMVVAVRATDISFDLRSREVFSPTMFLMHCEQAVVFRDGAMPVMNSGLAFECSVDLSGVLKSKFALPIVHAAGALPALYETWIVFVIEVDWANTQTVLRRNNTFMEGAWRIEHLDMPHMLRVYDTDTGDVRRMHDLIVKGVYTNNGGLIQYAWQCLKQLRTADAFGDRIGVRRHVSCNSIVDFSKGVDRQPLEHAVAASSSSPPTAKRARRGDCELFLADDAAPADAAECCVPKTPASASPDGLKSPRAASDPCALFLLDSPCAW